MAITNFSNFATNAAPLSGDFIVGFRNSFPYENLMSVDSIYGYVQTKISATSGSYVPIDTFGNATVSNQLNVAGAIVGGGSISTTNGSIQSQGSTNSIIALDRNNSGRSNALYRNNAVFSLYDNSPGAPNGGNLVSITSGGNVGIGTTNPTQKLHVSGAILATSLTAINSDSQTLSSGAIVANGSSGAFVLDDGGHKRLSWNDGGGNLNLRGGHYFNGTNTVYTKGPADSNGGAASITLATDTVDGYITLNVSPTATPGTVISSFANTITIDKNGTTTAKPINAPNTAKAWVNFDATRNAAGVVDALNTNRFIRSNNNISSVLRTSQGAYTITFTTPMVDSNYCVVITGNGPVNVQHCNPYIGTLTTANFSLGFWNSANSGNRADPSIACIQVFGN